MQVILSDGDLSTLSNMKLNLKMNQMSTEDDEPVTSECLDLVSDHVIVLAHSTLSIHFFKFLVLYFTHAPPEFSFLDLMTDISFIGNAFSIKE